METIVYDPKYNIFAYVITNIIKLEKHQKIKYFLVLCQIYGLHSILKNIYSNFIPYLYQRVKKTNLVQSYISAQTKPIIQGIRDELNDEVKDLQERPVFLQRGMTETQIIQEFEKMKNLRSFDYPAGKVSGAVYSNTPELDKLYPKIYTYFCKSNPLHTNLFPAVRKMENDLVKMMINFFGGDEDTVGCFTNGGTESILLACKTYRDWGYAQGIQKPNMIVSSSVHCAFHKAAKYFQIELITIPALEDGKFDLFKLLDSINKNTVLVVASAPSYNLGIVDPILDMAEICHQRKVGLHVDCCMGAFMINYSQEHYNFDILGVTSISADYHKYGMTPKGASVVMYHHRDLMKYQYFIDENWTGGVYGTSTLLGSKNGNIVALTWAAVMFLGKKTYQENYLKIMKLKNYFLKEVKTIPELFVYGEPHLNIIALGSTKVNINILGDKIKETGWSVNMIQNPPGFHFCITQFQTEEILGRFFDLVKTLIPTIPDSNTKSKCIYGTKQSVKDGEIVQDIIAEYLHIVNGF